MREPLHPDILAELSRKLTDEGKLIEAGWISLRIAAMPPNAPDIQLSEMRTAFFAGAQHLFGSIMSIMDEDREPTEDDLGRMDLIDAELHQFAVDFAHKHGLPEPPKRRRQ
jgi:hypothetical protein